MLSIRNPAIVLDLGVNGLGVVRSLGRKGVEVTGIVFSEPGVAQHSRYCEVEAWSSLEDGEDEFVSRLLALCQRMTAPPVLFPTSDEALALLCEHEKELASGSLFVSPARQTLRNILNKDATARLARECGIRMPATYIASSLAQLCELAPRMRHPVLFKPRNHYDVYLPGSAKNFTFLEPAEMISFFSAHPGLVSEGVYQEIISGGDGHILVCAAYLDRNSEPLAVYTGRKIRQLQPDYGVTSYGISEDLPEIAEMTTCFLKQIRFRGLVAVEYARERDTGQVYFLEINARSYYHNALFAACGVNLPWIAYLDAVQHPSLAREAMPRQEYGRKWVDLARDARSFRRKHKAGQLGWGPWLWSLAHARSFAVFAFDDLRPFLYGASKLVWRQIAKRAHGLRTGPARRERMPSRGGILRGGRHAPSKAP